jgi:hypothetical protein
LKRPNLSGIEFRYNVADPNAFVPPELLAPDGRYSCDRCDFLCERAELVELPEGFICPECIAEAS